MLMLYNSDSFAVVQFDIGRSPEDVNTPPRGGYEIVDKLARKEIFLEGPAAQQFKAAMDVSGIILTKLDGTAKRGVILGISDELNLPVRFVGIGEKVDDLRPFDPAEFVAALYEGQDA
mgnify:CR=1 FL=1